MRKRDEDDKAISDWIHHEIDEIEDDFAHPDKIPGKIGEEFEQIDNTLEKDGEIVTDFVKKAPGRARYVWRLAVGAHWLLNAVTVATPLSFFFLALNIGNTIFNAVFNKFWAHGNVMLLMNWMFMISQTAIAIPMLYEL